jgi:hypothetical protein
MSCERYTGSIADHACGAEVTPDLAHHLAGCAACAARLELHRRAIATLDADIQRALDIPISNTFERDVRVRLEQNDRRSAWWLSWGIVPAAAAILFAVWLNPGSIDTPVPAPAPRPSWIVSRTTTADLATPPEVPAPTPPKRIAKGLPAVEVIVPSDRKRAVSQFLLLTRQGALDASKLAASPESGVTEDLVVTPLTVAPIVLSDVEIARGPVGPGVQ